MAGGLSPLSPQALAYEKLLCAALDGFTLHAATRAGGHDEQGREALLRYAFRPPVAQERVEHGTDGLLRVALKRPFGDGTVAVEMESPLALVSARDGDAAATLSPSEVRGSTRPSELMAQAHRAQTGARARARGER